MRALTANLLSRNFCPLSAVVCRLPLSLPCIIKSALVKEPGKQCTEIIYCRYKSVLSFRGGLPATNWVPTHFLFFYRYRRHTCRHTQVAALIGADAVDYRSVHVPPPIGRFISKPEYAVVVSDSQIYISVLVARQHVWIIRREQRHA